MNTSSYNATQLEVPDELQEMLLDLTIGYLVEQPSDVVDYAIEFFNKLKTSKPKTSGDKYQDVNNFAYESADSDTL